MEEFPELQEMIRMYAKRQLQIVTVSIYSPDEKLAKSVVDRIFATGGSHAALC